jgi:ribosomal protein L37E
VCETAKIEFETPSVCEKCGFHNFNIVGSVYNGDLNYTHLAVQCMRCGHKQIQMRQPNI